MGYRLEEGDYICPCAKGRVCLLSDEERRVNDNDYAFLQFFYLNDEEADQITPHRVYEDTTEEVQNLEVWLLHLWLLLLQAKLLATMLVESLLWISCMTRPDMLKIVEMPDY